MGWLITLAVLALIALAPLGVRIRYDADGLRIALVIGFFKVWVFPTKPKEEATKNSSESAEKKRAGEKANKNKKTAGGSVKDFLPLVKTALEFLNDFRRKLRVNHLRLRLILGGGDPCDLALNYGKGWAVLGNLMPILEQVIIIQKRDLEVECDFTADQTTIVAGADFTICVWRLLTLAFTHGPKAIKQYFSIIKIRKGGANT